MTNFTEPKFIHDDSCSSRKCPIDCKCSFGYEACCDCREDGLELTIEEPPIQADKDF